MSKDKEETPISNRLKICGLLLALAVVDDKSEEMWLEFAKATGKDFDDTIQKIAFHYGEVLLDTAYNMDKFVSLVVDISVKENKKLNKKGVKKNARR